MIEHVEDDRGALSNIRDALAPGGRAVVLVPQGPGNFGTLDKVLGHVRRYTEETLTALAKNCQGSRGRGGRPATTAAAAKPWFLNGKLLKRETFGLVQIWALNTLPPVFRAALDGVLPTPSLTSSPLPRK